MRSELNEAELIDRYLMRQLSEEDTRAFEVRQLLDDAFAEKVEAQRTAHRCIRRFAWKTERNRLEQIYRLLLDDPDFSFQINTIFT